MQTTSGAVYVAPVRARLCPLVECRLSTLFTDDDVTAGAEALTAVVKNYPLPGQRQVWDGTIGVYGAPTVPELVNVVLAAVAPQIAARALRKAADDLWPAYHRGEITTADAWLRARADALEADQ